MKRRMILPLILAALLLLSGCAAPLSSAEPASGEPVSRDILITGSHRDPDLESDPLEGVSLRLTVDTTDPDTKLAGLELTAPDLTDPQSLRIVLAADGEGVTLGLPGVAEKCYRIDYDYLTELAQSQLASLEPGAALSLPQVQDPGVYLPLLQRYGDILAGLVNLRSTKVTAGAYELPGLGVTADECMITRFQPSRETWHDTLEALFTTAREDQELMDQLVLPLAEQAYDSQPYLSMYLEKDEFLDTVTEELQGILEEGLAQVDDIADTLSALSVELATQGQRVVGARVCFDPQAAVGYESWGEASEQRTDALVLYEDGEAEVLARNVLRTDGSLFAGTLTVPEADVLLRYDLGRGGDGQPVFDAYLSAPDVKADIVRESWAGGTLIRLDADVDDTTTSLDALVTSPGTPLTPPEGEIFPITDEASLNAAVEEIGEALDRVFAEPAAPEDGEEGSPAPAPEAEPETEPETAEPADAGVGLAGRILAGSDDAEEPSGGSLSQRLLGGTDPVEDSGASGGSLSQRILAGGGTEDSADADAGLFSRLRGGEDDSSLLDRIRDGSDLP